MKGLHDVLMILPCRVTKYPWKSTVVTRPKYRTSEKRCRIDMCAKSHFNSRITVLIFQGDQWTLLMLLHPRSAMRQKILMASENQRFICNICAEGELIRLAGNNHRFDVV